MGKRGLWGAEPGSRCCSLVANPGSRFWAASRSRVSCSELLPPSPAASPSPWLQSHILGSKCVISPSSTRPQLMPSLAAPLLPSTPLIPLDLHQILLIFPSENGHSSFFASWPLCPSLWVYSQSPQFVQSATRAIPGSRTCPGLSRHGTDPWVFLPQFSPEPLEQRPCCPRGCSGSGWDKTSALARG